MIRSMPRSPVSQTDRGVWPRIDRVVLGQVVAVAVLLRVVDQADVPGRRGPRTAPGTGAA